MKKAYVFLAEGFEEIEALTPVDILRRGGVDVTTLSVTGQRAVTSSHQVTVLADALMEEADLESADLLVLPGGMPGSAHLNAHEALREALIRHAAAGKVIGAICAAPMVLGSLGLLRGRRATCSPGFEEWLEGATCTGELVTTDGPFITGKGPGAAMPFAYTLLSLFVPEEEVRTLQGKMQFLQLIGRE